MASSYPGALDSLPTNKLDVTGQGSGDHAGHHNNMADAINKIEAELGVNPSDSFATVALFLAALQLTSEKGQANGYASLNSSGKVPSSQLASAGLPTGAVTAFAGTGAPSGYLLCDGSLVSRTTYSALFAVIGTTYGVGDGSTTFQLPDYRGRVLAGLGTHADVDALTDNDGAVVGDRRPKHKHTVNDPGHVHTAQAQSQSAKPESGNFANQWEASGNTSSATTGVTVGPQTNSPTDGPAYGTVNWIIKT